MELKNKHIVTHICFPSSREIFQFSTIFLSFQLKNTSAVLAGEHEVDLSGFFWCIIASNFYYLRCIELYLQKHHKMPQEQVKIETNPLERDDLFLRLSSYLVGFNSRDLLTYLNLLFPQGLLHWPILPAFQLNWNPLK